MVASATAATSHAENAALFASLISRTAQDIDILIDSLPNQEYTPERQVVRNITTCYLQTTLSPIFPQVERLQKLQTENQQAAEKLKKAVEEGGNLNLLPLQLCYFSLISTDALLGKIREAMKDISDSHFGIKDEKAHR